MKALYDLKAVLENEIKKVAAKGEVSPTEIKPLGEVVDILKDIETICAMKEYGEEDEMYSMENRGYSTRRMSRYPGPYRESYDDYSYENSYANQGRSNARGGNSRNSYNSYNYSGHDEKGEMIFKLEQMMNNAKTDKERMTYIDAIEALKRS